MKYLSESLQANSSLTKLDLQCTQQNAPKTLVFTDINYDLQTDNGVEDEGVKSLIEALKVNTTLTKLHLGCMTPSANKTIPYI